MPSQPDRPFEVLNNETGRTRIHRYCLLGRLLRDDEKKMEKDSGPEDKALAARGLWSSRCTDIFYVENTGKPMID